MRPRLAFLLALLALLAGGAAGAGASGTEVLDDCTDDERMSKTYAQRDYRDALDELAADTDQYGNCRDVIRRAMLAAAAGRKRGSKGSSKGGDGGRGAGRSGDDAGAIGSAPAAEQLAAATPQERDAIDRARSDAAPFATAGTQVDPDAVGRVPGPSRVSDLPAPLVALLVLLLIALLALAGLRIRDLVHARRG